MNKYSKLIMVPVSILVGGALLLNVTGFLKDKHICDMPEKSQVSYLEIYGDSVNDLIKHHTIENRENISEIYDVIRSGKKSKTMKSLNDTPTDLDGKLTRIVLTDENNCSTELFAYQSKDGKSYIEKPYEGIYEITEEDYDIMRQYFIE